MTPYFLCLCSFIYLVWLFRWRNYFTADVTQRLTPTKEGCTILLPVRNEEKNLAACIEGILKQKGAPPGWQLYVLDDFSTDSTAAIAQAYAQQYPTHIHYVNLEQVLGSGRRAYPNKKQAITYGVEQAKDGWIVCTDGDCLHGEDWLSTLLGQEGKSFVSGPVTVSKTGGLLQRFCAADAIAMAGVSIASAKDGLPVMCNGANLAFTKEAFLSVNGYQGFEEGSGDDVHLLYKIQKYKPEGIAFLNDPKAVVITRAPSTLSAFWQQRLRWTAKSRALGAPSVTLILILLSLYNMALLLCCIVPFLEPRYSAIVLASLLIKGLGDVFFLSAVQRALGTSKEETLSFIEWFYLSFLHIIYVSILAPASLFVPYTWKGRKKPLRID